MGKEIAALYPAARRVFERVDGALGTPLSRICFEGPPDALRMTATTQPAILATSIALFEAFASRLPPGWRESVACAAGHSLGEYSALVAASSLEVEAAVRLVQRRGKYMQEAVPDGAGAMAAVMGADLPAVEALCRAAAEGEVLSPANLNAPGQTVVAGTAGAVRRLTERAREHGIRRVVPLEVSAPFHCDLMGPARDRLRGDLESAAIAPATFPVVANFDARGMRDPAAIRAALERQVTAPVRWVESIVRIRELGAEALVEIGPGRILSGLSRKIDPVLRAHNIEDPASLEETLTAIGVA
jgi:[acyl-carrier-protein] S-malonyltransferase